jgi:hypothetical protein
MLWPNLKYDANLGGYRVPVTEDSSRERRSLTGIPSGVGPTATGTGTERCTTITKRGCGIDRPKLALRFAEEP